MRSLPQRAIVWSAITVVVIGALGLALGSFVATMRELQKVNDMEGHSGEVIRTSSLALSALQSAEFAQRGFLLTADKQYLGRLSDSVKAENQSLNKLGEMVKDSDQQLARVAVLKTLSDRRVRYLNEGISKRKAKGLAGIVAGNHYGAGQVAMDDFRGKMKELLNFEDGLLKRRQDRVSQLGDEALSAVIVAAVSGALWMLVATLAAVEFFRTQRRLAHLTDSVGDAFYALDSRWRFTHFNDAAGEFLSMKPRDVLGRNLTQAFPSVVGSELEANLRRAISSHQPVTFTTRSPTTGKYIDVRCFPSKDGVIVFFHDVTERVEHEIQIRELNESLEEKVQDRTAQLEGFCYSIAHDMRMHIRGVTINASIIREELAEGKEDVAANWERLTAATKQMARLVDDLLEHARTSSVEVRSESVDLSSEAREVAQKIMQGGAYQTNVEFFIAPNLSAVVDRPLIHIVLQNLFDNACKYSKAAQPTRVEFGAALNEGPDVFFVSDNGIGFDPNYSEKIFLPFERLHSDGKIPGSGIGLANVKRIIERHGGRIWAHGTPGEGSTFYFTLCPQLTGLPATIRDESAVGS